ncbi:MAG: NlpC/P60 family peptidoglycan-binding protein RipD [Mycobacterium sp.]
MKRIFAVAISLALLVATPGIANADSTHQQAISTVIARALSQRGVPYAYGGGNVSGPSMGTATVDTPATAPVPAPGLGVDPLAANAGNAPTAGAAGLNLTPLAAPVIEPRVTRVGFDASGLIVYAFAGAGIKMPRTSGDQYKVGQKVLPSQALPGDLLFYGPEGTQSVALFIGNGQMVEATDPAVTVSPVRTAGMTPYLVRIIS